MVKNLDPILASIMKNNECRSWTVVIHHFNAQLVSEIDTVCQEIGFNKVHIFTVCSISSGIKAYKITACIIIFVGIDRQRC